YVLSYRCDEELLAHVSESPQTQAPQSDLILQFCKQGFHLFSLPLCFGELRRVNQRPRTLSGWFVLVDDKAAEGSTGALWSERAWAAFFACPDVVEGSIAINSAPVVEYLAGGADIAIVFWFVRETLGAKVWTPLSVDTVAGSHVRSDVAIRQPLQEVPVPVGRVGRYRFWLSPLPLRESSEHVLGGHSFLAHACRRRLHSYDHATGIVHQVVVVVTQSGGRSAFGRVGGIRIGGRYLFLLMHRFLQRVL